MPEIWHDHIPKFGERFNLGEHELIGQAINYCTNKKTKKTGNNVIQLTFATTGGASTRSVSCQSHSYSKY